MQKTPLDQLLEIRAKLDVAIASLSNTYKRRGRRPRWMTERTAPRTPESEAAVERTLKALRKRAR